MPQDPFRTPADRAAWKTRVETLERNLDAEREARRRAEEAVRMEKENVVFWHESYLRAVGVGGDERSGA